MAHKTILIAEDDMEHAQALKLRCQELGVGVRTASDGLEALRLVRKQRPDLLVLDIDLPGADGLSVCEQLRTDQGAPAIPAIILTGPFDQETIRRCQSLSADCVHKGLEIWPDLKPLICGHLGIEPGNTEAPKPGREDGSRSGCAASAPKILVIDDDPQVTRAAMIRLGALGIEVIRAPNAKVGNLLAKAEQPDVIITDYIMPGGSGESLLINLKNNMDTRDIPVIVITGQTVEGHEDLALKREMLGRRGAVAYFGKPLDFEALLDALRCYIDIPSNPAGERTAAARPA